jgi:hypothetical protein
MDLYEVPNLLSSEVSLYLFSLRFLHCTVKSTSRYTLTYHSCFIPERVAEVSQNFLQDIYQNYLVIRNTADVTGGKPITV